MIDRLEMEELRRDIMEANREDMLMEIKLRNDDDYFYDHLTDKFSEDISALKIQVLTELSHYDREENVDDWFDILLGK